MLLQQEIRIMFFLNRLVLCLLPTAMSFLIGNHTMDMFYLSKENFKNLLFYLLITGSSRICLIYQVVCCHKVKVSEEYTWKYYKTLSQTLFPQKYKGLSPNTFYSLEAYDINWAVVCLKVCEFFVSNFKANAFFLSGTVQLGVAKDHINLYVIKE